MPSNIEVHNLFTKKYGNTPEHYMDIAAAEMIRVATLGYPPFVVVVIDALGKIIDINHDKVKDRNPLHHAEINSIELLCSPIQPKFPTGTAFVASSEPCLHCLSGMLRTNVTTIVFGARTESDTFDPPFLAEEIISRFRKYPVMLIPDVNSKKMTTLRTRLMQT